MTPRYMRHYNVLSILDFDNASLTVVFTIIVDWWARKTRFPHDVRGLSLKDFLETQLGSIRVIPVLQLIHLDC